MGRVAASRSRKRPPEAIGERYNGGVNQTQTQEVWNERTLSDPHAMPDKAKRVRAMFAAISRSYDLNNRLHSMGRDQTWRRIAVATAGVKTTDTVLDVACGTGDLSLMCADAGARRVIGVDFTHEMLRVADTKRRPAGEATVGKRHRGEMMLADGDAMRLPIADRSVDVVSIAFGLRNVADPRKAIGEFYRVLRPNGRLVILEFSLPTNAMMRGLYQMYFRHVMPWTATLVSRDRTGAYRYLPRSVNTFVDRQTILKELVKAGFVSVAARPLTFGVAVVYSGRKRK